MFFSGAHRIPAPRGRAFQPRCWSGGSGNQATMWMAPESGTKKAEEVVELRAVIRLPSNAASCPNPARTVYSAACSLL